MTWIFHLDGGTSYVVTCTCQDKELTHKVPVKTPYFRLPRLGFASAASTPATSPTAPAAAAAAAAATTDPATTSSPAAAGTTRNSRGGDSDATPARTRDDDAITPFHASSADSADSTVDCTTCPKPSGAAAPVTVYRDVSVVAVSRAGASKPALLASPVRVLRHPGPPGEPVRLRTIVVPTKKLQRLMDAQRRASLPLVNGGAAGLRRVPTTIMESIGGSDLSLDDRAAASPSSPDGRGEGNDGVPHAATEAADGLVEPTPLTDGEGEGEGEGGDENGGSVVGDSKEAPAAAPSPSPAANAQTTDDAHRRVLSSDSMASMHSVVDPDDPAEDDGSRTVVVRWLPPLCDGGSPLIMYLVSMICEDGTQVTTTMPATKGARDNLLCSLPPDSGVTEVRVSATNAYGVGTAAVATASLHQQLCETHAVRPPSAPVAPVGMLAEDGSGVKLHWHTPLRDGGAPIDEYVIEYTLRPRGSSGVRRRGGGAATAATGAEVLHDGGEGRGDGDGSNNEPQGNTRSNSSSSSSDARNDGDVYDDPQGMDDSGEDVAPGAASNAGAGEGTTGADANEDTTFTLRTRCARRRVKLAVPITRLAKIRVRAHNAAGDGHGAWVLGRDGCCLLRPLMAAGSSKPALTDSPTPRGESPLVATNAVDGVLQKGVCGEPFGDKVVVAWRGGVCGVLNNA